MFVYDAVSLGSKKSSIISKMVGDLINDLELGNDVIRVGRLTDNCPATAGSQPLSSEGVRALDSPDLPGLDSLLTRLRRQGFSKTFGSRSHAIRMVVLFVDDDTQNIEASIAEIKRLGNAEVFVVAIGNREHNATMAQLSSDPTEQHLVHVHSYAYLLKAKSVVLENLCLRLGLSDVSHNRQ
jgi:hypothetical protein